MDVREKLVELIRKGARGHTFMPTETIANYLVENGVTVQERGKWIQHCFEIECTNCHQEALRDSFNKYVFSDYCPHCGAKMTAQPPKGEQ